MAYTLPTMPFLAEIRRRGVLQVAAVYAVTAWLLVQIAGAVEEPLLLPDYFDTFIIVLVVLGFPIALILAWAFNLTPGGLVRDRGREVSAAATVGSRALEVSMIVLLLFAVGLLVYRDFFPDQRTREPVSSLVNFSFQPPLGSGIGIAAYQSVAISSGGMHIALVRTDGIYLRTLGDTELTRIRGTEGINARGVLVSPNGEWVAFADEEGEHIVKVRADSGAPTTVAEISGFQGGSWSSDGRILYSQGDSQIYAVDQNGGIPEVLISLEPGQRALNPQLLPGGDWVLFTIASAEGDLSPGRAIYIASTSTEEIRYLFDGTDARYIEAGYLVFGGFETGIDQNTLSAMPFDIGTGTINGAGQPLIEDVAYLFTDAPEYAISLKGNLVFRPASSRSARNLAFKDDSGADILDAEPRSYSYARISPDGNRIATDVTGLQNGIWTFDSRGGNPNRLLGQLEQVGYIVWMPDSSRVIFRGTPSDASARSGLYMRDVDGGTAVETLIRDQVNVLNPNSISPDGESLVYRLITPARTNDLLVLDMTTGAARPLLVEAHDELNGEISPVSGEWLLLQSNETGTYEIHLRTFPDVQMQHWQVSTGGGVQPTWDPVESAFYYLSLGGDLVRVPFDPSLPGRPFGEPAIVLTDFISENPQVLSGRVYDVSTDGTRFLIVISATNSGYEVLLNVDEALAATEP